ncbi:FAD-dependent oxidoreductase [Nocardioides pantholopis]|uniref:FAD-dependent oxidoreductase n=1 Tax=Nocardioides pantholopis TaxID=2483798 RepID=UPI000F08B702|nr:FAD-dependent oxidoreductase [Nocardioides pantholopis]
MATNTPLDRIVVIGGSIAGLAAAATAAGRAREVLVVERREPPATGSIAPQGHLPHVMLAAGSRVLEQLFAGFAQDLLDRGASSGGADPVRLPCHWVASGSTRTHLQLRDLGFPRALCSRSLVESRLRAATLALPGVRSVRASVEGLALESGRARGAGVAGVRLRGVVDPLDADLVIDASGRGSHTERWLPCPPPATEVVVDLRYTAYVVERHAGDLDGAAFAIIQNTRDLPRLGVALPMEGQRWQVVLGGYFGTAAPRDGDGARSFARTLADPVLATLLSRPALEEPAGYSFRSSRRRHWDRLGEHPRNLCVLGDAAASFNPVYGQGMSAALLQAEALGRVLDRAGTGPELAGDLAREVASVVDGPWLIATGADFVYPATRGRRPPGNRLVNRYVDRVTRAAAVDDHSNAALTDVQQLTAPPASLFRPGVLTRTLRHGARPPQRG